MSILDPHFKYTPSIGTDVVSTWKKFGFKPTTDAERIAREKKRAALYDAPQPELESAPRDEHAIAARWSRRIFEPAASAQR